VSQLSGILSAAASSHQNKAQSTLGRAFTFDIEERVLASVTAHREKLKRAKKERKRHTRRVEARQKARQIEELKRLEAKALAARDAKRRAKEAELLEEKKQKLAAATALQNAKAALTSEQITALSSFHSITGVEQTQTLSCISLLGELDWNLNVRIAV
jgi:hypothetical protein